MDSSQKQHSPMAASLAPKSNVPTGLRTSVRRQQPASDRADTPQRCFSNGRPPRPNPGKFPATRRPHSPSGGTPHSTSPLLHPPALQPAAASAPGLYPERLAPATGPSSTLRELAPLPALDPLLWVTVTPQIATPLTRRPTFDRPRQPAASTNPQVASSGPTPWWPPAKCRIPLAMQRSFDKYPNSTICKSILPETSRL